MREDLDDMSIELRVYADANARAVAASLTCGMYQEFLLTR